MGSFFRHTCPYLVLFGSPECGKQQIPYKNKQANNSKLDIWIEEHFFLKRVFIMVNVTDFSTPQINSDRFIGIFKFADFVYRTFFIG